MQWASHCWIPVSIAHHFPFRCHSVLSIAKRAKCCCLIRRWRNWIWSLHLEHCRLQPHYPKWWKQKAMLTECRSSMIADVCGNLSMTQRKEKKRKEMGMRTTIMTWTWSSAISKEGCTWTRWKRYCIRARFAAIHCSSSSNNILFGDSKPHPLFMWKRITTNEVLRIIEKVWIKLESESVVMTDEQNKWRKSWRA